MGRPKNRPRAPHPRPAYPEKVKETAVELMKVMEAKGLTLTECNWVQNELRRLLKNNRKCQPLVIQNNSLE